MKNKRTSRRVVVGLGLGTLLVLPFWTVKIGGQEGGPNEAARYQTKRAKLSRAIASGGTAQERFTESEINAFLAGLIADNAHVREAEGFRVGVRELRCDVTKKAARFFVSGRLASLPFVLEYRVTGREADHEEGALRMQSVRMGHLPLVQPLRWIAVGHLKRLMGGVAPEREILEHLKAFEIDEDTIRVSVAANADAAAI